MEYFTRLGRRLAAEIMDPLVGLSELNISMCPADCNYPRGKCINGTCHCEFLFSGDFCEHFSTSYLTTFASLCYILFLIASIQLILCMVNDSQDGTSSDDKWKKAFRITIRKCLLGTVIGAMGTRAIYFTVQNFSFPDKWATILHDVYYPSFITAFSVLICFWAEVFYNNLELSQTQDFMKSHRYFIKCTVFNILVYLLLLADIVATPLVGDVEQKWKSVVIGSIFIFLLLCMLIGFLHYGVRLFFRPDWRPLCDVFKINLKQQWYSCVGVVSNALMQCLIIALLLLNLASRFGVVDFHSLCTSNTVIHVIELGLPIWFCCTLWDFKRPSNLWLLNPGLLLQAVKRYQGESKPFVDPKTSMNYGSVQQEAKNSAPRSDGIQDCWICLDQGDVTDFFKPCKCSEVHRQCLARWMMERTTSANIQAKDAYQCQVCKTKYRVKRQHVCVVKELSFKHWFIGMTLVTLLVGISSLSILIQDIKENSLKAILAFSIIVMDAIILQLMGFGLYWMYKRTRSKELIVLDESSSGPAVAGRQQQQQTMVLPHPVAPPPPPVLAPLPPQPHASSLPLNYTSTTPTQITTITILTQTV